MQGLVSLFFKVKEHPIMWAQLSFWTKEYYPVLVLLKAEALELMDMTNLSTLIPKDKI